jgi:signal transduction histidine kinase
MAYWLAPRPTRSVDASLAMFTTLSRTIVVLHIGGARRTLRRDPDTAELALVEAERVARDSLDGIRRIVGLLRDESDEPGAASLDLEELVASYGRAGLDTSFTQRGTLDDAPLLVRVALRRVLQEALANASQHAAPRSVVEVTVGADAVAADLHVVNAVDDPHRASHGGYGLVGLREQISHLGGELAAGARDGRWRVDCRIPYSVVEQA